MSSAMKSTIAMLLGALLGLTILAMSLDTLVPENVRQAVAARNH